MRLYLVKQKQAPDAESRISRNPRLKQPYPFCSKPPKLSRKLTEPILSCASQSRRRSSIPELNCMFLGARNVGKSSIIRSLEEQCQGQNISRLFNLRAREVQADQFSMLKLLNSSIIFIIFSCTDEHSWLTARQLHVYLQQQQISLPVFFIGTHAAMAWKQDRVYFDLACLDMKVNLLLSCGNTTPCNLVSTLEELYRNMDGFESPTGLSSPIVTSGSLTHKETPRFWTQMKRRLLKSASNP